MRNARAAYAKLSPLSKVIFSVYCEVNPKHKDARKSHAIPQTTEKLNALGFNFTQKYVGEHVSMTRAKLTGCTTKKGEAALKARVDNQALKPVVLVLPRNITFKDKAFAQSQWNSALSAQEKVLFSLYAECRNQDSQAWVEDVRKKLKSEYGIKKTSSAIVSSVALARQKLGLVLDGKSRSFRLKRKANGKLKGSAQSYQLPDGWRLLENTGRFKPISDKAAADKAKKLTAYQRAVLSCWVTIAKRMNVATYMDVNQEAVAKLFSSRYPDFKLDKQQIRSTLQKVRKTLGIKAGRAIENTHVANFNVKNKKRYLTLPPHWKLLNVTGNPSPDEKKVQKAFANLSPFQRALFKVMCDSMKRGRSSRRSCTLGVSLDQIKDSAQKRDIPASSMERRHLAVIYKQLGIPLPSTNPEGNGNVLNKELEGRFNTVPSNIQDFVPGGISLGQPKIVRLYRGLSPLRRAYVTAWCQLAKRSEKPPAAGDVQDWFQQQGIPTEFDGNKHRTILYKMREVFRTGKLAKR